MRSFDPEDKFDVKYIKQLKAEPWMLDSLNLNPAYTCWGNNEDYMFKDDKSWASRVFFDSINELWGLDDYNECVHFYFNIDRKSENCNACDRSGLNPETYQLSEDFYDLAETGKSWGDNITQEEVEILQKNRRLQVYNDKTKRWEKRKGLTAEEVNLANKVQGIGDFQHDGINRSILIEARAKRLGYYGKCKVCKGEGSIYIEPKARLQLQLWILHPRKGAARGVMVNNVKESDLPRVYKYLKEAAKRNAERFSTITKKKLTPERKK